MWDQLTAACVNTCGTCPIWFALQFIGIKFCLFFIFTLWVISPHNIYKATQMWGKKELLTVKSREYKYYVHWVHLYHKSAKETALKLGFFFLSFKVKISSNLHLHNRPYIDLQRGAGSGRLPPVLWFLLLHLDTLPAERQHRSAVRWSDAMTDRHFTTVFPLSFFLSLSLTFFLFNRLMPPVGGTTFRIICCWRVSSTRWAVRSRVDAPRWRQRIKSYVRRTSS